MDFTTQEVTEFKKVIESIVDVKLDNRRITNYVSAIVDNVDNQGFVSVIIPPEMKKKVTGLLNKTGEVLNKDDSVEIATKNGLMSNAWVAVKHGTNNSGGGGGGGTSDYNALINKPRLNSAITTPVAPNSNELLSGVINLHRISKTGNYNDLLNKPNIPDADNFIQKSGDNMTGSLTLKNNSRLNIDNAGDKIVEFLDNGVRKGRIRVNNAGSMVLSSQGSAVYIRADSDTSTTNQFVLTPNSATIGGNNILLDNMVIDNVSTATSNRPLSANQGRILNDTIVGHIGVGGVNQHPLANGVIAGFSLNNYTTAEKTKLTAIPDDIETTNNKVAISANATVEQYPNAKSVYDYGQDIVALIPAGGLKIPVSLLKESDLPTTGQKNGDYYFIQDMDVSSPGHTGRAWWNTAESTTEFLKVVDQYQSMDGVSIVQSGGGEWGVSSSWLGTQLKTINGNQLVGTGDITINSGTWGNITGSITNQTDLATALNTKVDKVSTPNVVYSVSSDGTQSTIATNINATANTIAVRDTNGRLNVAEPTANTNAATKAYVDSTKLGPSNIIAGDNIKLEKNGNNVTINSEGSADAITSPDKSVQTVITVTPAEWKTLVDNNQLIDGMLYNVLDGANDPASTSTPIGATLIWWGNTSTVPNNYLLCAGQSLKKSEYQSLFDIIGYTYGGSGDNFNLPNIQGKVVVELDSTQTEFNTLGKSGGSKTVALTVAQLPSHTHDVVNSAIQTQGLVGLSVSKAGDQGNWSFQDINDGPESVGSGKFIAKATGSGTAHNNIQPYITGYYIIKVQEEARTENLRNLDEQVQEISKIQNIINPTLLNGWKNYMDVHTGDVANYAKCGYYKDRDRVYIKGLVLATVAIGESTPIYNIPIGYRPSDTRIFSCMASISSVEKAIDVRVHNNGTLIANDALSANDWISLDGINYDV